MIPNIEELIADDEDVRAVLGDRAGLDPTTADRLDAAEAELREAYRRRDQVAIRTMKTRERIDAITRAMATGVSDQEAIRSERAALMIDDGFADADRRAAIERVVRAEIGYVRAASDAIQSRNRAGQAAAATADLLDQMAYLRANVHRGPADLMDTMRSAVLTYDRLQAIGDTGADERAMYGLVSYLMGLLRPLGESFRSITNIETGHSGYPAGKVLAAAKRSIPQLVEAQLAGAGG